MIQYIVKRVLLMIPTMAGILVISFLVIKMAPGDPAALKFGAVNQAGGGLDVERGTEAPETLFRKKHHLDEPLHVQLWYFVERLAKLDLRYLQRDRSIWPDLLRAIQVTVVINLIVFVLIYVIAIPMGIFSAAYPHSAADRVSTVALFVLYSLPSFWAAEVLRSWFIDSSRRVWFPIAGLHSPGAEHLSTGDWILDYLHHITLPVICLTYGALAYLSRQMRAGMLEVIRQDYIRTAEAKGAGKARVILVHALRNGLFPIITLFASLLPFLIGGSVIIEYIFNIPGMGRFAIDNVFQREYDAVMATLTLSAILTLLGILISDVMYVLVNPQVTFQNRR